MGNIDNEIRQVQDEIRDLESQLDSTTKQAKQEAYAKIRKELYDSSYQPGFDKAWGIINNGLSKAIQIKEFEEAFDKLNSLDDYWFTTVGKSIVGFFDHNELKDLQNQKAYLEKLTQAVIKVEPWNSNQNFNKILAAYLNSLSKISSLKPLVPQIQHSISIAREAYQKTKLIEIPIPANDWDWDDSEFNKALAEIKQTQAEYKIKTEQTEVNEITKEFEKIAEEHQKAQKKDENNAKNQESEELWSFSSVEDIEAFFKESLGDNLTRQIGELWKNVAQIEPIYNDTIFNLALEEFIKGIKALDLWKIDQKSLIQVLRQGIITKRKAYQTTQEETLKDSRTKFHKQFDNTDYLSLKAITEKQATLKDKQARRNALEWRYKNQTKAYNRIAKIQQELVPGNNLDNNLTEAQAKYKTAQIKLQTAEKAFETQRNIMIQNESLVKYSRTLAGQLILADAYPEEQWNKDVGLAQKNNLVEQDTKKDLAAKMVEAGKEKTTIPEALKDAIDELPTEMKIVGIVLTILTLKGRPDLQKILGGIGLAGLVGHLWIKASTWGEMGLWDLFEGGVEQLKGAKNLLSAIQKVEYRNVLMKLLEKDPNNAKNVVALTFIAVETKLPELIKPDNTGYLKKQPDGKVTVDDAYFTEITSHEFTAEDGTKVNIWDYFDKIWIWPEHFQDAIQMFLMQVAPDKQAGTAYTMIQDKLNWGNPQTYDPTWEGYSILDVAFNSIESPLEKARELQKDEKERLEQIEINKFKKAFEALGLKIVKDIKKEKGVFVASLLDYKLTDIKFVDGKLTFVCEGFDSDNNSSNGIQGWDKNNVEDLKEKIQTKEFEKIKSLFPTDFGRTFGLNFENGNFNLGKEKSDDVDFIEFTMKSDNTNFETVQYMRDGKLYVINEFEIYGNEMKGNIWIEKYSIPIILDSNWDITFWNWIKYIDSALENARKWSQELIQKKLEKLLEDKKNEITNAFKVAVKDISTKKTFGWNDVDFYTSLWEKFTKNNLTNKTTKEDVEVYANFVIDLIQIYEGKLSKWGISILNNELPWLHLDKVMLKEYEISQLAEFLKNTPLENFSRTPKFYIDHSSGELLNAKTSNITPNKLIDAIEDWSGNDNDAENSFKPEIKAFFEELLKWAKWQSDEDLYKAYLKANLSLKLEKAYTHNYLNPDKYVLKTELGDLGKNNKWDFTKLGLKTYEEWKKPSDNAFGINQTPQQALGLTDALYNSYFTQKWYKIEKNDTSGTFDIKYKGNVLSVLDWKKLKIDNYELDQWYEINDTPFKILALMEEVKTKKTFSSNYSAFDHYSNRIEFQIDWHNSPKVNLAWENSDFIKKTTRLLSYWYFGWNSFTFSQTKDEFVWRYKEIESFYSNNKATLNNIITEIRQKYLRTENPCSGFYLQKDDIMVSIDMGADKNIKEICKSINFSLFGWKEYYLMLALNRAWFETN